MASAAGRVRTNQGDTMALMAAAPMAAQPAPLKIVAAKSCHGDVAAAQPRTPIASDSAPALVTAAQAEAAIERRQVGHDDGADQEMRGDRRRDERQRPAARRAHRLQIDRRAVEAEAPAEHGEHEGRADHPPSVECVGSRVSLIIASY